MLPLLLGAGRMLAAGAVRGAAGQTAKGAIVKTAKNEVKEKAVKISKDKLLNRESPKEGGGGALVKQPVGALVKASSSAIVKKSDDTEKGTKSGSSSLLSELVAIKSILESIKKVIDSQSEFDKNEYDSRRKSLELSRRKEKETKLEERGGEKPSKSESASTPGIPFFERIKRFLLFTFLGSIANWAFTHLPKIINIIESIAKGIDSTLEVVKFAVVSIATNFPKQIKFLAKLTKKLFAGPAKLIGKLILKTGKFAFELLSKAGSALLNFVKTPIQNITKRVLGSFGKQAGGAVAKQASTSIVKSGGQQAAKQGGKEAAKQSVKSVVAGNSSKLLRRLSAFRSVLKRVPVVGALIAIGIDLALGEPLDRAVIGAIGSTIGAAIGGAIGTGVIPIPVVGTAVGGVVGGAIGDWLAKKLYGDLTGRLSKAEKESSSSNGPDPFTSARGGLSEKEFDKKYGVNLSYKGGLSAGATRKTQGSLNSRSLTRKTGTRKRSINKIGDKLRSMFFGKGSEIKTLNENEVNLFKSKSRDYLLSVMNIFNNGTFVGDLLKLGSYMTLGKVVKSSEAESVANTLTNEFYNSPFTEDISDEDKTSFTYILKKWAKDSIVNNILSFQNSITPLVNQRRNELGKESSGTGPGSGTGDDNGSDGDNDPGKVSGPVPTGGSADFWALAAIASREDVKPQGSADVAQSIYNRAATGAYGGGRSIKNLIIASGQYEPTFKNRRDWAAIKDRETAIKAAGSATNVDSSARAILNPTLQKKAAEFVGGRTDFMGESQKGSMNRGKGDITRGRGYNFHGWFYNARLAKPAGIPNFGASIKQDAKDDGRGSSPSGKPSSTGGSERPNDARVTRSNTYQANIGKSTSNVSTKSTQLRTQASYELNYSPVVLMQMPSSPQPQLGGTKANPSSGQQGGSYLDSFSIDIEKTLYSFSLY